MSRILTPLLFVSSLVAAGLLAAGTPAGPSPPPAKPAPRIRFDVTFHDFGKVPSDKKLSLRWTFHNDGEADLRILGTRPSCACTATLVSEEPIPAGGSGFIDVTFDPTGQHGQVKKTIAVTSNDLENKVVLLVMRADVIPSDRTALGGGHPPIAGQSLLMGDCASCHARPASGKSGAELYGAVCAMCHGAKAEGSRAPSLRTASYLKAVDDKTLTDAIAFGTANPRMPGFSDMMGGPLSAAQIDSLVKLLRAWGPAPASPAKAD